MSPISKFLLPLMFCAAFSGCQTARAARADISQLPESIKLCRLINEAGCVGKTIEAWKNDGSNAQSSITTRTYHYSNARFASVGIFSFTETENELHDWSSQSLRPAEIARVHTYAIPMKAMASVEKSNVYSHSSQTKDTPTRLTNQGYWIAEVHAKGKGAAIKKHTSSTTKWKDVTTVEKTNEGTIFIKFKTNAQAQAFADAWNALIAAINSPK